MFCKEENRFITEEIKKNRNKLLNFISHICRYYNLDIDDIYQEVCIVFMKKYDKIDKTKDTLPYMCGIAKKIIENNNRMKFNQVVLCPYEDLDKISVMDKYNILYEELVLLCTKDLSKAERNTFEDCFISQLTHEEISKKRKITEGTSKMRKRRLVNKLRKRLSNINEIS